MELLLLWALTYAIVHASRQTWRHGKAALLGRPLPPSPARPTVTDTAAAGVEAAAGGVAQAAGSIWQAAGDGWRAGWHQGRTTRADRGRWRPWDGPTVWVAGPGPRPQGEPSTPSTPPAGGRQDTTDRPSQPADSRGDGPGRQAPCCWSELSVDEQRGIVADVRAAGREWGDLSVDEAAAAVRAHLRVRYGLYRVSTADILTAQARHDDPTWRTGPPASPTPTPAGATTPTADDDISDAEIVAPRCWSDLTVDEQRGVMSGLPWDTYTAAQRDTLIAEWISARYRVERTATDVAAEQAARDAEATAACTECVAADRDGRLVSARAADHRLGCPTGRFFAERHAGYTGWLDQDGLRVDGPTFVRSDEAAGPSPDPTSPPLGLMAHDSAATAAGIPALEGAPFMTTGSGETTNIQSTRTYYEQLAGHARSDIASRIETSGTSYDALAGHVTTDITQRIELSTTYLTASQLADEKVLAAIATAKDTAEQLATALEAASGAVATAKDVAEQLAAAADAVPAALEAHRLMEEAVASTPGAAAIDWYRRA